MVELAPAAYMQPTTVWAWQQQCRVFGEALLYCIHLHTTAPASKHWVCAQPHSLSNDACQRAAVLAFSN